MAGPGWWLLLVVLMLTALTWPSAGVLLVAVAFSAGALSVLSRYGIKDRWYQKWMDRRAAAAGRPHQ